MKKCLFIFLAIFLVFSLNFDLVQAFSGSEVHITKDGTAKVSGLKVMQSAGSTFYTRLYWGDTFVRVLLKTTSTTKFYRATGETTSISEVSDGDWLDIVGELEPGSSGLTLIAYTVKNSSVQKLQSTFSGKVTNVNLSSRQFSLETKTSGTITVQTNSSTVFVKGSRNLDLEHVKVGDTITKTFGDYDISTKTLVATNVKTFIDPNYYKPKLFLGKLTEVVNVISPVSIKVNIDGVVYVVNLNDSTQILNTIRNSVSLSRFVVGDSLRIWGAIREVDDPIIDAQIVRNVSI